MQTLETQKKIMFMVTKANWGGAQKYVYEMAKALNEDENFSVSVAFGGDGILREKLNEIGIKTHQLLTLENDFSFSQVAENIKEINKLIKKEAPDIIHLNSSKISYFGAFCGRFFSKSKIIFTSHGWPYNEDRPIFVKIFLKMLMAVTIMLSHKTIAVSKKIKFQTPFYFLFRKKVSQIYFGLSNYELVEREGARKILNIESENGRLEIITTAELHSNKGYQYALGAMRNLVHNNKHSIHYHIIGEGNENEKIRQLIQKYNLGFDVTMHGFVKDAAKYMKAFDIFLLTSITEALGYVVLEAGYASLPVVATAVGGIPEIIQNNVTGLLARSKNPKDIKEKLNRLIEDKELRNRLATNLNIDVNEKYTFKKTIEETKKIYKKMFSTH